MVKTDQGKAPRSVHPSQEGAFISNFESYTATKMEFGSLYTWVRLLNTHRRREIRLKHYGVDQMRLPECPRPLPCGVDYDGPCIIVARGRDAIPEADVGSPGR